MATASRSVPFPDVHAMKHEEHVLGRDVTRGALGVRAAAEPSDRTINHRNTRLQAGQDVGKGLAVSVVKVQCQPLDG